MIDDTTAASGDSMAGREKQFKATPPTEKKCKAQNSMKSTKELRIKFESS